MTRLRRSPPPPPRGSASWPSASSESSMTEACLVRPPCRPTGLDRPPLLASGRSRAAQRVGGQGGAASLLRCGVGIQAARRRHRRRRHLERQAARRCPRPSWPCAPLRAAACAGLLEAAMAAGCVETGPGGLPMPGWPSRRYWARRARTAAGTQVHGL